MNKKLLNLTRYNRAFMLLGYILLRIQRLRISHLRLDVLGLLDRHTWFETQ